MDAQELSTHCEFWIFFDEIETRPGSGRDDTGMTVLIVQIIKLVSHLFVAVVYLFVCLRL